MDRGDISVFTILTTSPFDLFEREDEKESFVEVIKHTIAPYYKFKSLTTILITIMIIIYITLVFMYPPFLRIPTFAAQPLELHPENLQHFEFYRLFTSLFVFQDLSTLIVGCIIVWSFGSYTEEFLGYRMALVFSGLIGLIGSTYYLTLPCFLMGCNFAYALLSWPDPNMANMHKKMLLVIYIIIALIYFFVFFNLDQQKKMSSYYATIYVKNTIIQGIMITFIFGLDKDGHNLPTFRKLLQFSSIITFILINCLLIINIIFFRKTFL